MPCNQPGTFPIPDDFMFAQQTRSTDKHTINAPNKHFSDIAAQLNGKPFDISFMTGVCAQPVAGGGMLCQEMAKTLAAISNRNASTMHVVISSYPKADSGGGLWVTLGHEGLSDKNTIVLIPSPDETFPDDGAYVATLQSCMELRNTTEGNPLTHSAMISSYTADGDLCNKRPYSQIQKDPSITKSCTKR